MPTQQRRQSEGQPPAPENSPPIDLVESNRLIEGLRHLRQSLAATASVVPSAICGPRGGEALGILMYHRVAPNISGTPAPTYNVTPQRFRAQLAGLLALGYEPWPLRKVLAHRRSELAIPRKAFVVTFDDGYQNNYCHAWPILKELGVPATIFLATAYLDEPSPFPFDDWSAAGAQGVPVASWKPLGTSQCGEMLADGLIDLGSHTHTHADYRNRPDALVADLRASLQVLHARFGLENATFAFPYGSRQLGFSGPVLSAAARQAGLLCSLTTEEELVGPHFDPFDWGRFAAHGSDSAATLAAKLDGWYSLARHVWRRLRGQASTSDIVRRPVSQLGEVGRGVMGQRATP